MRIKVDENLPREIASRLKSRGHDVHTAWDENLCGSVDEELWEAVQREKRFLLTQDLDFSDARRFAAGTHHGILLVRLHTPSRKSLIARVDEILGEASF
jgi:predicted nuclease of predicted toxin-antitoxin system